jgi:hypothetical protein
MEFYTIVMQAVKTFPGKAGIPSVKDALGTPVQTSDKKLYNTTPSGYNCGCEATCEKSIYPVRIR